MKKSVLILSLAALATVVGCQREDNLKDPVENGGVREVTTQFVLNVASAPTTKMSADVVQQNNNFRGMDNARIYVYNTGMAPADEAYVVQTDGWTSTTSKLYDLGILYGDGSIDNEDDHNLTSSSNRVLQLSIPVGTDAVSIYAKAKRSANTDDADYGGTNMDATVFDVNPKNTVIAAKKILANDDIVDSYDATGRLMIFLINDILSMEVGYTTEVLYGFPGTTYPVPTTEDPNPTPIGHRDISWNALGHQYEIQTMGTESRYNSTDYGMGRTIEGLEEVLGRCYYLFTFIKPGEYRTGSSGAVKTMVADMYKVISDASAATPTNEYEANAKRLAVAILNRAKLYFSTEDKGDYKPISEIHTNLVPSIITETYWNAKFKDAANLNGYPFEDFGIPRGAAQLAFRMEGETISTPSGSEFDANNDNKYDNDVFYYLHPNKPLVNPTMASFEPRKYIYPAELWYYVNSPVRVTDKSDLTVSDFPDGVTPWASDGSWTGWTGRGVVQSSTRGVAVKNNINYGVALLKSSVLFGADSFFDNRYEMTKHKEADREITKEKLKLELFGVLVGGVNPRMNWQFLRKYSTGDLSYFDGVIYDHSLESTAVPSIAGEENYTLVYDNYSTEGSGSQTDQRDVYIALEFKNIGDAFWGRDNLIPTNGYFYLVAKIEKPNADQISGLESKWPTDHQIPPIYGVDNETVPSGHYAGESKKIARVFMQDFMTEVKFKFVSGSLKNAYYTMPDLRASQMSLGLSVDLQWTPGLVYNEEL